MMTFDVRGDARGGKGFILSGGILVLEALDQLIINSIRHTSIWRKINMSKEWGVFKNLSESAARPVVRLKRRQRLNRECRKIHLRSGSSGELSEALGRSLQSIFKTILPMPVFWSYRYLANRNKDVSESELMMPITRRNFCNLRLSSRKQTR